MRQQSVLGLMPRSRDCNARFKSGLAASRFFDAPARLDNELKDSPTQSSKHLLNWPRFAPHNPFFLSVPGHLSLNSFWQGEGTNSQIRTSNGYKASPSISFVELELDSPPSISLYFNLHLTARPFIASSSSLHHLNILHHASVDNFNPYYCYTATICHSTCFCEATE